MRQIGSLPTETDARRLVDCLKAQGISAMAERDGTAFLVWVRDEDQLAEAKITFETYVANPADARFEGHNHEASRRRREEEQRRKLASRNTIEVRNRWSRMAMAGRSLTITLVVLSVLVSLATEFGNARPTSNGAIIFERLAFRSEQTAQGLATPLADIAQGQLWRLITPAFLHGDAFHLLFNMLWLYELGGLIERRRGPLMLALLVLGSALFSNFGQAIMPLAWGGSPFVIGMSGVVYGLFGYLWIGGALNPEPGMRLAPNVELLMTGWLLLGFSGLLNRIFGMHVANWAHLYGLLVGAAWAYAYVTWRRRGKRQP